MRTFIVLILSGWLDISQWPRLFRDIFHEVDETNRLWGTLVVGGGVYG